MVGVRRGEEQNGIGDFLWVGDFIQWDVEFKLFVEVVDLLLFCIVVDLQGVLYIGIGGVW